MPRVLTPDICVIGAGAGGIAVATGAAAYGLKVVLVDRSPPETSRRRVAAKAALLAAAGQAQSMRVGAPSGIDGAPSDIDFTAVMTGARKIAAENAAAASPERLSTLGVAFIQAEARFLSRSRLMAGETEIRARRYVLATGSSPALPAITGLDEIGYLTPDSIFDLTSLPEHLVVVGGDGLALELAQCLRRLGSRVTVLVEATALPGEDREMVAVVLRRLRAEGVVVEENAKPVAVEAIGESRFKLSVELASGPASHEGSHLLVSAGRAPDVEPLDLRKARVALKGQAVDVSAMLRTTNRRIYAIGDVAGAWSVQAAKHQAELVLKPLVFRLPAKDRSAVPYVVHTEPGFARIGLTETQAARRHKPLTVLRSAYVDNDRARAMRRTEGHVKLVVARSGQVIGVTIAGLDAAEAIGIWTVALANNLTLRDVAASLLPHATAVEIGKSAAMSYFSRKAPRPLLRNAARLLQLFG
jgi:pyruvate/2-oxoglutarate dehydrogenase complex dihydrolipoamide dehydrogenase (E3) component